MAYTRQEIIETLHRVFPADRLQHMRVFAGAALCLHGHIDTTSDIDIWVEDEVAWTHCKLLADADDDVSSELVCSRMLVKVQHNCHSILAAVAKDPSKTLELFWDPGKDEAFQTQAMTRWQLYKYHPYNCTPPIIEGIRTDSLESIWTWYRYLISVSDNQKYRDRFKLIDDFFKGQHK